MDAEFEGFGALLGMHSWSDFLLSPTAEEVGKSSEVYFCRYTTSQAVKDHGTSF